MRYIKYITALFAFFAVVASCIDEDVVRLSGGNGNCIQLVGRVMPFTDVEVDTRSPKNDPMEYAANTMDLMIFGSDNTCVFAAHQGSGEDVFTIDRGNKVEGGVAKDGSFENINQNILNPCKVYAVANIPEVYSAATNAGVEFKEYWKGKTFAEFEAITTQVNGIGIPQAGMPMVGMLPETLNLRVDSEIKGNTPYQIPMKALYAKMVFTIDVVADQNNTGITPNFEISDFTVHNLVKYIPLDFDLNGRSESSEGKIDGANDDTPIHMKSETEARSFVGAVTGTNIAYDRYGQISFSFYLPERYLRAKKAANEYEYPFLVNGSVREEDKGLRQRYKPKLAQETATYMTMSGVFTNHQGHTYDVDYDIYVGADNYSNFDVVRNHQYNNYITIKGIQNSSDQSNDSVAISIDHRVNVNRTLPFIVNLRRETLLDSHFEVRPLRIRANMKDAAFSNDIPTNAAMQVKVEYVHDKDSKWIGLERSFGNGTKQTSSSVYCTGSGSSAGKRLYFTTDLTTGTLAGDGTFSEGNGTIPKGYSTAGGQMVVVPLKKSNECIWIYVDECLKASYDIKKVRTAKIIVTYGTINNGSFKATTGVEPLEYILNQHYLFAVDTYPTEKNGQKVTYYIEHEEEYLHNFDSDEAYGENLTEEEGMPWGLNNVQLSRTHDALVVKQEGGSWITTVINWCAENNILGIKSITDMGNQGLLKSNQNPKYDFYLNRDNEHVQVANSRDFSGKDFNEEIAATLKDEFIKGKAEAKIDGVALDEKPQSAFAYCYNRNKRNADGNVVSQNWIMPAIDEIEDIMECAHSHFDDFHGKLYWSCQPSFEWRKMNMTVTGGGDDVTLKGDYYVDDIDRARATRAEYIPGTSTFEKPISSSVPACFGTQNASAKISFFIIYPTGISLGDPQPFNYNIVDDFSDHPGNKPRTAKCRVRAVYVPSGENNIVEVDNTNLNNASDNGSTNNWVN